VPGVAAANRGDVIRVELDTTELGRGGGKWGEGDNWRSGVPLA